ncbi:uncharacterized protein K02A2.6-like [Haliotis rufescens]|uniref:uncharacterized protein K02A2.6-like n=1 Tax=Haliotis rufescens TaxID=6454 RepID=UPI00201FB35F|nr:uncharacterized protein K02A2.6-like [Haliotis rufescens]
MAEEQAQPVTQATFQGNIPPPPRLELKGNLAQNWKRWRQIWDSFEVMARIDANDHKYRLASFITYIGPEALDIYNGLPYESEEDKENMDTVLTLMERHCLGETNVIYERYIFNQRSQMEERLMTIDTCEESVNCVVGKYPTKIFTTLEVNSQPVRFQVDCGATCNVISKKYLPEDTDMQDTLVNLKMYNGSKLTTMGTANLHLRNPKNSKKYHGKFVVIAEDRTPLIGSRSAQQMNFMKVLHENIHEVSEEKPPSEKVTSSTGLTKEDILKTYPDIFSDELGTFEGTQKLEIDPSITPVKQPLRRIPHALKQDLKTELERLEKRGVITPVDTPTDWVSSLLIVKKPSGRLRLCIDPKPLNKALKRCHYPLPVMEDILPDIAEAKVFSKCDLKDGFWHIVLDEDSSYLTTFGTPFGRYRWLRLPFGVSPAPEIFQQRIDQLLQDLPGVFRIADDILIIGEGSTKEEGIANHDKRFVQFMIRCREKGIRLNSDKLDLKRSEVSYIGHLLTDHGLKPDPRKVKAILQMPTPTQMFKVSNV